MIIANAAGTPFIITGAGITPDYIYPIINLDLPVPNPNKEAIIFANDHGYDAVLDSYRSNPVEAYLAGKVPSNVDKYTFIDSLNVEARKEMIWPSNVNAAYLANDKSNVLDTSAQRVAYIPELVQSISSIDYILTIFVLLLSILICAIVIRRYVGNSSRTIGVMQANGVGKSKIALSMAPFVLIPTLAGGIGGYLAGTFLQAATLQLFKGYWLIPSPLLAFS
jgi:putative ABC transport system permease protein